MPNDRILLNFKGSEELNKIRNSIVDNELTDRQWSMASPFRMSKKKYKPLIIEDHHEELQKSIMGISFKLGADQNSLRESFSKGTPRKSVSIKAGIVK